MLTESILLSLTGGILGLILGYAGVRWLLAINPGDIPRIGETGAGVGIDWRVLVFTLTISVATGILFGLFPAIGASRPDLNSTLKESSNRAGTGFRQNKARSLLVVSEVSLALILLVGAALLIRTFVALRGVDPGFNPHNVLTMYMSLTGDRYEKTAGVAQLARLGRERLNAIPGVEAAASTCCLPLEGGFGLPFIVVGRPLGKEQQTGGAGWMSASPQYFDVFRIPIMRGRDFTDNDTGGAPGVVLINQTMAKKYWPKEDPVGQQIIIGKGVGPPFEEPARQIIGVVGDIRDGGLNREPRPLMIVPQAQVTDGMTALNASIGPVAWLVRTHSDPRQLANAVSEQLRQASNGFPVARVRPMEEVVVQSTAREDFNMLLLTIFGAAALVLAAIGIYGLMAYSAQQRTQEMGIRMALGADRSRIRSLVIWNGMRLALVGIVLGIGAAFALAHLIASFLFGVKWRDPLSSSRFLSFSPSRRCLPSGFRLKGPQGSTRWRPCARNNAGLWVDVFFEGGEDDVLGEELGEDVGGGVWSRGVDDVGGDAAAVDRGELFGDLGIVLGPVGAEEGDVVFAELMLDVGGFEDGALVDLAAEAPGGGEVDEDGMAGGAGLVEGLLGVGGPDEGGVFGLVERDGEGEGGDEDRGDGAGPAGGPFAEHPTGDGEGQEAAEEEGYSVDALAAACAACEE